MKSACVCNTRGASVRKLFPVFNTPHDCVNRFLRVKGVHVAVAQTLPPASSGRASFSSCYNWDQEHSLGGGVRRTRLLITTLMKRTAQAGATTAAAPGPMSKGLEHTPGPRDMIRSTATARSRLPRRAGPGAGTHVYTTLDERRCAAVCKVRSWWLGPF